MPFDGQDHGASPLLPPHAHHPDSPSTGVALANALRASYMFSRTNSRMIGCQTYQSQRFASGYTAHSIYDTSFNGIGEFRCRVPSHATHVECVAYFYTIGFDGSYIVNHRVVVTDGTNTDTGTTYQQPTTPVSGLQDFTPGSFFSVYDLPLESAAFSAALSTVTQDAVVTVTPQAYAVDDEGTALSYRPLSCTAFWSSYG